MGVPLLASLTLLPWHSGGPAPTIGSGTGHTAIQSPGAWAGIAAAVTVTALVAWLAVGTLTARPPVPPPGRASLALAAAAFVLVLLKLALDTANPGAGTWASLVLSAALVAARVSRPG